MAPLPLIILVCLILTCLSATPPASDNAARNLSIDFVYALSLEYHKEEYYLPIHADRVEMLQCAPTTSRAQPHELIQAFLNDWGTVKKTTLQNLWPRINSN